MKAWQAVVLGCAIGIALIILIAASIEQGKQAASTEEQFSALQAAVDALKTEREIDRANHVFLNGERMAHMQLLLIAAARLNACEAAGLRAVGKKRWAEYTGAAGVSLKNQLQQMKGNSK